MELGGRATPLKSSTGRQHSVERLSLQHSAPSRRRHTMTESLDMDTRCGKGRCVRQYSPSQSGSSSNHRLRDRPSGSCCVRSRGPFLGALPSSLPGRQVFPELRCLTSFHERVIFPAE